MELSNFQPGLNNSDTQKPAIEANCPLIHRCTAWFLSALLGLFITLPVAAATESPEDEVRAVELAFARAMAERDLEAFSAFVSEEAIFFSGTKVLRGKSKVLEVWSQYFTTPEPPFSWEPDQVEVLESGTLALSTGPVRDPSGKVVARFNSIWRLEGPNRWRVVFDKGSPASPGPN